MIYIPDISRVAVDWVTQAAKANAGLAQSGLGQYTAWQAFKQTL